MADVTEVIHKISYEVNSESLTNATKAIQLQIAELQKLSVALDRYIVSFNKLSDGNERQLAQLGQQVELTTKRLTEVAVRSKGLLQEILKGLTRGITGSDGLGDAVSKYFKDVIDGLGDIGDAAKETAVGFAQYQKGAEQVERTTSTGLGKSLKQLGDVVLNNTNLTGVAVNALFHFGQELIKESGIVDKFINKQKELVTETQNVIDKYSDVTARTAELASEELAKTRILYNTATDAAQAYNLRLEAVNKLQEQYPAYFGNLSREAILTGNAAEKYNELKDAIIAKATVNVFQEELMELIRAEHLLDRRIKYSEGIANAQKGLLDYEDKVRPGGLPDKARKIQEIDRANAAGIAAIEKERTINLEKQQSVQEKILDIQKKHQNIFSEVQGTGKGLKRKQESIHKMDTKKIQPFPSRRDEPKLEQVGLRKDEDEEKSASMTRTKSFEISGERSKEIANQINGYQQLAQAAADAYNKILQVQIDTLDKEISLREKRVEEAKKLAERGNTEALRLEEERLRKAQQQREQFARRQQAVNAAITVSNAIAAVARAALEGGGFGSVATIAALIAALAAGYAAVTSLSNDSGDAFADGVIDYKGKGGPRDDKNWVRISSGESIITAEGTKKNRALLEAINNGAGLQIPGTALPFIMPGFKSPGTGMQGQYASATDMLRLETKLDEVVNAIESNKLKQDIFFNEQGVGIMTERAIQRDRRRWK